MGSTVRKLLANLPSALASTASLFGARARLLGTVASAVMLGLSLPGMGLWPLAWVALVPWLVATANARTGREALLLGWLCGGLVQLMSQSWLLDVAVRFSGLDAATCSVFACLWYALHGLRFAVCGWCVYALGGRAANPLPLALVAPLAMASCEVGIPELLPWNLGVSLVHVTELAQLAEWAGPVGLTMVLCVANGALSDLARAPKLRLRSPAFAAVALASAWWWGHSRLVQVDTAMATAPSLNVGVVEPNIQPGTKGDAHADVARDRLAHLQETSRQLSAAGAELLLWTETVYPYSLPAALENDFPQAQPARIRRGFDTPLVFGASTNANGRTRNSAFLLDTDGAIGGRYDKNVLVPFGERVPLEDVFPVLRRFRLAAAGHFVPGSEVAAFELELPGAIESVRLAPLICIEDAVPSMGRRLASLRPHLLLSLSNDAWFAGTVEPEQHLALSILRSVETRASMVRAVNGGISSFVDPAGRVLTASVLKPSAARPDAVGLLAQVPLLEGGGTFYALHGDLIAWLCFACLIAALLQRALVEGVARNTKPGGLLPGFVRTKL